MKESLDRAKEAVALDVKDGTSWSKAKAKYLMLRIHHWTLLQ